MFGMPSTVLAWLFRDWLDTLFLYSFLKLNPLDSLTLGIRGIFLFLNIFLRYAETFGEASPISLFKERNKILP